MNIQAIIDETIWQPRVDKVNASAQAAISDAKAKSAFRPVSLSDYVKARIADIEASYDRQNQADLQSLLGNISSDDLARLIKLKSQPADVQAKIVAAVDALPDSH